MNASSSPEGVTAQRAEDRLRHLAATDALTGLANYRTLSEAIESEIKRSERTARAFAVLIFDLNGMKRINDSRGHLAGNYALCRLADFFVHPVGRLIRRRDMVATNLPLFFRKLALKKPTRSGADFANNCPMTARSLGFQ
jgi:GGDEF domain-containing protein